jgi:aminoglycoside phosphotransferase (APT) family kinase protein
LKENANRYYVEVESSTLQLRRTQRLRNSTFYHFELRADRRDRTILVKAPVGDHHRRLLSDGGHRQLPMELRAFPKADLETKGEREFQALSKIEQRFLREGDQRFEAIRVLDYLPRQGAIVTERLEGSRSLGDLLGRSVRFRSSAQKAALIPAFHRAGTWLRQFHQLPPLDHTETRYQRLEEWLDLMARFVNYLSANQASSQIHADLLNRVVQAASVLPENLPLALGHGDFAPRNVLLTDGFRVSVLDTSASWQVPLYFDLASFLFALKMTPPQLTTLGLANDKGTQLLYEDSLLAGYFGDEEVPKTALRLFEMQQLLAFWVSIVNQGRATGGLKGSIKRARQTLWSLTLNRYLKSLLEELDNNYLHAQPT